MKRHMSNCESCIYGDFKNGKVDEWRRTEMLEIGKEIGAFDNDEEQEDNSYSDNLFEFVTDGSFVALYSAPNSLENFLVCEVH